MVGEETHVPVTVGTVTTQIFRLALHATPYDLRNGCLSTKVMQASLDFDEHAVTLWHGCGVKGISLVAEGMHGNKSISNEVRSDKDSEEDGEE